MLKKSFKVILKMLIVTLVYLMQIYVVNNVNFFGVKADLCLMLIVVIALVEKQSVSYIITAICAVLSDAIFSFGSIKYILIYIIITVVLVELKKTYNKDSKLAIILFAIIATAISEVIMYIIISISGYGMVNIFITILNILKQSIINIGFAYILFFVLKSCGQEG